jgi:hypothetical protein
MTQKTFRQNSLARVFKKANLVFRVVCLVYIE